MIYENEIHPHVLIPKVSPAGAETDIGDAQYPNPFYIGLEYSSPARGHWTIAHSPMLIPECHEIYVCCACCLHGVVLSADEIPAGADRFSMVTLTNENILKGDLEKMMIDGISHIIDDMPIKPKCVEGFTSCMQHFLHIDLNVVYGTLRKKYPRIDFIDGYMIPTLQRRYSPDVLGRRQLTRAITEQPKRKKVNYMVNYYPVDCDNELSDLLLREGWEIGDFAACRTYEEYKDLGAATVNIYFHENSKPAALDLQRRLGQKPLYLPYSFTYRTLRENLSKAASALHVPMVDCAAWEARCDERLQALKQVIHDTPIAIDYTATPRPLGLALLLLQHGFSVYAVYVDAISPDEKYEFFALQKEYPSLSLRSTKHYKRRVLPRDDAQQYGKVLCMGQMAAYFTGSDYFVNIIEHGGLYGYSAIIKLCDQMEEAMKAPKDTRHIIQIKAWGCHG